MDIRERIGGRIAELRTKRGLSQSELAGMTGLRQETISKIERGRFSVSVDLLGKLTDALGASVEIIER